MFDMADIATIAETLAVSSTPLVIGGLSTVLFNDQQASKTLSDRVDSLRHSAPLEQ